MSVRIRLEALSVNELDAHETALREVLTIPGQSSQDYPNRRHAGAGQPGCRRYLESAGTRTSRTRPEPTLPPRAAAEQAKARRDLGGELGALMAADADLETQPWAPLQAGDVVLCSSPARDEVPAIGETYLAIDGDTDLAGHAMLRPVSTTYRQTCDDDEPLAFYDLWFEAGPSSLAVIRAGAVIHGTPTCITPPGTEHNCGRNPQS